MTAAAVNPIAGSRISLEEELGLVADRLRRSTVRVFGGDGCGSGVIWRPDGVIVSNAQVARVQHLRVELDDGRVLTGSVIARDARCDLAAVRVAGSALPAVTVRDARTLRAG